MSQPTIYPEPDATMLRTPYRELYERAISYPTCSHYLNTTACRWHTFLLALAAQGGELADYDHIRGDTE